MSGFTTCVVVASNSAQAARFRGRIQARRDAHLYPREVEFLVLSDPDGGRVGSGGAALLAACELRERLRRGGGALVINAGGESRRLPTYAPEGKLFAPLPLPSSGCIPPVVLDHQVGLFLRYPWTPGEMIVTSGDVTVDFDTELLPEERGQVYGLAKPESFELGSRHGVFRFDRSRSRVVDFFQKAGVDFLREHAALEGSQTCALDMGIVGFGPEGVARLLSLADSAAGPGVTLLDLLRQGRCDIDLYVELMMALLSGISFESYAQKVAPFSRLGTEVLASIHGAFRDTGFCAHLAKGSQFLHFGSLPEYGRSCGELVRSGSRPFYAGDEGEIRPVVSESALVFNSIDTTCVPCGSARQIYVEGCRGTQVLCAGGENLFVGLVGRRFGSPVPAGICLDERQTSRGRFLLVYGIGDTWRPEPEAGGIRFCGIPLPQWATERGIELLSLFPGHEPGEAYDLLDARLFVESADESFTEGYWGTACADGAWRTTFGRARRCSIREVAAASDLADRDEARATIRRVLLRDGIVRGEGWLSISQHDFVTALKGADPAALEALCDATDNDLVKIYRRRLLDALLERRTRGDAIVDLRVDYLAGGRPDDRLRRAVKADQIVWARSPVRLDLAGGWTDTPPFTLREGGEVVNVAVNLNGQPPIQAFCRPTPDLAVRFHSIDLGATETVHRFEELESFNVPGSPFALAKAALCLILLRTRPAAGSSLESLLRGIGCGLELSLLCAVPKGSGLGTSSILGATILAALERFLGLDVDQDTLVRQVLQLEQMLTTGGGWQDQIGGVIGGVKYIASTPGLKPRPVVYQLDPFVFSHPSSAPLFTLYYTGITRLAKNILEEVVDRVNSMEPDYLFTLRSLKSLARGAREAISRRDLASLARVLDSSWRANKLIHDSTTNEEVEALVAGLRGRYSGLKLLGAGGGGYLLFLSATIEDARRLRDALSAVEHERARIVDMSVNGNGLEVTVS
jgi:galactokinase/mevalonate kinase-like predicted kinase